MPETPEQPAIHSDAGSPASDAPPAAAEDAPEGMAMKVGVFEHREPEPEPSTAEPAADALEQKLADALDEDDLPEWAPPAGVVEASAVARPEARADVRVAEVSSSAAVYGQVASDAATTPSDVPSIAGTLEVPPLKAAEYSAWGDREADGEGGEFQLLINRLKGWWEGTDLDDQLRRMGGPLRAAALLLGVILLLRLYSGLLDTLADLPLVPRLLQLIGLIAFLRFCFSRLIKSSERQEILAAWKRRWQDMAGTGR